MALTCSARIEVHSLDGCLELLGNRKLFYIEICTLNDIFCTDSLVASKFMIFDEVFVLRKEFPKSCCLQDIVDLLKDNSVQFSLMEITNPCCIGESKSIASAKMPLNSFMFPSSNIKKYHTVKLFPHQRFRPVLKFWVEAVIYRAYPAEDPQVGPHFPVDIPTVDDVEKAEFNYEDEDFEMEQDDMKCVLCDVFKKHLGKPYSGHHHARDEVCLDEVGKSRCKGKRKPRRSSRFVAKGKVEFWLNQLHMLSSKPIDEFTNLLRNIYTKEYSKALSCYNSLSSRR